MRILITGCSSGFGRLAALALAEAGHRVYATMRNTQGKNASVAAELGALDNISVVDLDVSSDASVDAAVTEIASRAGGLDVVINNAGVAGFGYLEGYSAEQMRRLFDVNVFGVQRVCRASLPALRESGGLLVFVSSVMGRVVIPCTAVYTASKFALEAMAESYAYELGNHGVEVSIVQPGSHPTAIGANMAAWGPEDAERVSDYGPMLGQIHQGLSDTLSSPDAPDPAAVSRALVELIAAPKGSRSRRIIIDDLNGEGPAAINQLCDQVQSGMIEGMGLSELCKLH